MSDAIDFNTRLMELIRNSGKPHIYPKGACLISEGKVEQYLYYIESGAVRAFLLSGHEDQTVRFGYKGSIINSLSSFINGSPSPFYIEAIRKTSALVISKAQIMELVYQSQQTMRGYIALLENLTVQQIEREIDLLTTSPLERLLRVLDRSPNLFQEVPLKYIASYLRMTPETLSRIRNS